MRPDISTIAIHFPELYHIFKIRGKNIAMRKVSVNSILKKTVNVSNERKQVIVKKLQKMKANYPATNYEVLRRTRPDAKCIVLRKSSMRKS